MLADAIAKPHEPEGIMARRVVDSISPLVVDHLCDIVLRDWPLNDREVNVLILRYGLAGSKYDLEYIGKKVHATRETVRQIEMKAIAKIPSTIRAATEGLADYLRLLDQGETRNV